ncbi:MAG: non-ribosomal peptide synthetase [Nitrospirae bacterium]|nr:non-ribosomal peptide synthetase [Nitrospirota bacterium]
MSSVIDRNSATILQATPATWRLLLDKGRIRGSGFKALVGGEAMPIKLADRLIDEGIELWNMYGPTESTVWSTCARITETTNGITIGRPIANTLVRVLDASNNLCPIGIPGELFIGGDGVALGYWNRPELTAERFLPDIYGQDKNSVLYRTGDIACWRNDGNLDYLGRLDSQVKLRGFRIELGEIESTLETHPNVGQTVVVITRDSAGEDRLVAFYIQKVGKTSSSDLREFLKEKLPDYMVPQHFVELEEFPLTPNGKIDRRQLQDSKYYMPNLRSKHVAPVTELEKKISEIWQTILNLEQIGVNDTFFELGGNSLSSANLIGKINDVFNLKLPLAVIFNEGTVSKLAQLIEKAKSPDLAGKETVKEIDLGEVIKLIG